MADKKKFPPLEVIKEMFGEAEIPEEVLDEVAGGAYTTEEWNSMSTAERQAAQQRSIQAYIRNQPCEMD